MNEFRSLEDQIRNGLTSGSSVPLIGSEFLNNEADDENEKNGNRHQRYSQPCDRDRDLHNSSDRINDDASVSRLRGETIIEPQRDGDQSPEDEAPGQKAQDMDLRRRHRLPELNVMIEGKVSLQGEVQHQIDKNDGNDSREINVDVAREHGVDVPDGSGSIGDPDGDIQRDLKEIQKCDLGYDGDVWDLPKLDARSHGDQDEEVGAKSHQDDKNEENRLHDVAIVCRSFNFQVTVTVVCAHDIHIVVLSPHAQIVQDARKPAKNQKVEAGRHFVEHRRPQLAPEKIRACIGELESMVSISIFIGCYGLHLPDVGV